MVDESEARRLERKAERRARKRAQVVDVAERLTRAHGPHGFTTEALAAELGMSQASVFYYFTGGRGELLAAVALRQQHRWLARFAEVARGHGSGVAALEAVVREMFRVYQEDPDRFGEVQDALVAGPWSPELTALHVRAITDLYEAVAVGLEADRAAGRLHPDVGNPRRWAMTVVNATLGVLSGERMRRLAGGRARHSGQDLIDDLCAMVRRGSIAPGA